MHIINWTINPFIDNYRYKVKEGFTGDQVIIVMQFIMDMDEHIKIKIYKLTDCAN